MDWKILKEHFSSWQLQQVKTKILFSSTLHCTQKALGEQMWAGWCSGQRTQKSWGTLDIVRFCRPVNKIIGVWLWLPYVIYIIVYIPIITEYDIERLPKNPHVCSFMAFKNWRHFLLWQFPLTFASLTVWIRPWWIFYCELTLNLRFWMSNCKHSEKRKPAVY